MAFVKFLLFLIYYFCFSWLCILVVSSIAVWVIAGGDFAIIFLDEYVYRWYNWFSLGYIMLRVIGGLLHALNRKISNSEKYPC